MSGSEAASRNSYNYDVFLSHNHAQKDWTRDLARKLRDEGFEVVYSATPYGVGRYSGLRNRFLPPLTASSGLDDPQILRIAYDDGTATLWVETPLGALSYNDAIHEWRAWGDFGASTVHL